jgi:hypothetical protein
MRIIRHNFPREAKAFAIIQPPTPIPESQKLGDVRVVGVRNPNEYCDAKIFEILHFDIHGTLNCLPDWLSLILFGIDADPILAHIIKSYPEAAQQNKFEIWIAIKQQSK